MLDPRKFDQSKSLVMKQFTTVNGHDLDAGAPLTIGDEKTNAGQVDADTAIRLWMSGRAIYADDAVATPTETPAEEVARATEIETLGDGRVMLRAPNRDAEFHDTLEDAEARKAELITEAGGVLTAIEGVITDFVSKPTGGGWYEITGPGITEPLKIQGEVAAAGKIADLREARGDTTPAQGE